VLERNYSVVVRAGPEPVTPEFQIRRPNSLLEPYWEYWLSVVFVRTSLCSVPTATTSSQYSPLQLPCSVCKRLIYSCQMKAIMQVFLSFSWGILSHVMHLDQSHERKYLMVYYNMECHRSHSFFLAIHTSLRASVCSEKVQLISVTLHGIPRNSVV